MYFTRILLSIIFVLFGSTALAETHTVGDPGTKTIALALQAARDGDVIQIPEGTYTIQEKLVVDKAVTIMGAGSALTVLEGHGDDLGVNDNPNFYAIDAVIDVDPGAGTVTFEALQIVAEEGPFGFVHLSGDFKLMDSKVVLKNSPDQVRAVLFAASGPRHDSRRGSRRGPRRGPLREWPSALIMDSFLLGEWTAGDRVPTDSDLIVADSGSLYKEIAVLHTTIVNQSPNAISAGIEWFNSRVEHTVIRDCDIMSLGESIILLNNTGTVDIRNNTIWSGTVGMQVHIDSEGQSYISENVIQVDDGHYDFFPEWLAGFGLTLIPTAAISFGTNAPWYPSALARNVLVTENVFLGNPEYGIAMLDSWGHTNVSSDDVISENDFTQLGDATCHIAQDADVHDITIEENVGLILPCP
jgi:hypothetical protein